MPGGRKRKAESIKHPYSEYYFKGKNGKYIHTGYGNTPSLHDGLWLIRHDEGCTRYDNILYQVDALPEPVDVKTFLKAFDCQNTILEVLKDEEIFNISRCCLAEKICRALYVKYKLAKDANKK